MQENGSAAQNKDLKKNQLPRKVQIKAGNIKIKILNKRLFTTFQNEIP